MDDYGSVIGAPFPFCRIMTIILSTRVVLLFLHLVSWLLLMEILPHLLLQGASLCSAGNSRPSVVWVPLGTTNESATSSLRVIMVRSKMGDMVRAIRNDLPSPPPIERDPCPAFLGFPKMDFRRIPPPAPKTRKSTKHPNRMAKANHTNSTLLRTPRPMKRNAPLPILLMDQHASGESIFDRPVSPPICESPPLSHNPVFKANAAFFDKLKGHFFTCPWWHEVGEILESKRCSGFVFMLLERIVTPSEYFYSWCVEFFFQHHRTSLKELGQRMKELLRAVWDMRLGKYIEEFHKAASTLSQESGVVDSFRSPNKTPNLTDMKWNAVVQPVRPKHQPAVTTHSTKRKRRYSA
eukprot:TRINITY_DN323_c0_g2_i1.p1 TRINITY_DN323_c0_g2~~TRINITY_DN323_c0_g2_i1.p1  ORF type:complete len:405 (+),score=86.44 TRINITY_DN323_c0_g2_i1:165-1217(+)